MYTQFSPLSPRTLIFLAQKSHPDLWKEAIARYQEEKTLPFQERLTKLLQKTFPDLAELSEHPHDIPHKDNWKLIQSYLQRKSASGVDKLLRKIESGKMLDSDQKLMKVSEKLKRLETMQLAQILLEKPLLTCTFKSIEGNKEIASATRNYRHLLTAAEEKTDHLELTLAAIKEAFAAGKEIPAKEALEKAIQEKQAADRDLLQAKEAAIKNGVAFQEIQSPRRGSRAKARDITLLTQAQIPWAEIGSQKFQNAKDAYQEAAELLGSYTPSGATKTLQDILDAVNHALTANTKGAVEYAIRQHLDKHKETTVGTRLEPVFDRLLEVLE